MAFVTIGALIGGFKVNQARTQKHIVEVLIYEGAEVQYAYQFGANNKLLPNARSPLFGRFVGVDFCSPVLEVHGRPAMHGDIVAQLAGKLPELRALSMQEAWFLNDKDLLHLSDCRQLVRLDLSSTDITDGAVPFLCSLKQLQRLDIQNTDITHEGALALRNALPNCTINRGTGFIGGVF